MTPRCPEGDRLRATLTDRVCRVGRIDEREGRAMVFAPREGECRRFSVALGESRADVEAGRVEVVGRSSD